MPLSASINIAGAAGTYTGKPMSVSTSSSNSSTSSTPPADASSSAPHDPFAGPPSSRSAKSPYNAISTMSGASKHHYALSTPNLSFGGDSSLVSNSSGPSTPRSRTRVAGVDPVAGMGMAPVSSAREATQSPGSRMMAAMAGKGAKGNSRATNFGDRFIPQRSSADMAASFQLLEPASGTNGVGHGRHSDSRGPDRDSARRIGSAAGEIDAMKEEANRAFTHLLKAELFSATATSSTSHPLASGTGTSRPTGPFHSASTPNLPIRSPATHPPQSPVPHNHHPAGPGYGVLALPPLPSHVPSTPTSLGGARGAFSSGSRGSAANKNGVSSPGGGVSGFTMTPTPGTSTPTTPTRKRLLNFASPTSNRHGSGGSGGTSSPNRTLIPASPGNFTSQTLVGGGYGVGPGVGGVGLDDMLHEKYLSSPAGRESQRLLMSPRKSVRWLSKTPFKVLDAPELADDFYLNLVSWSSTNVLGVGLNACVYLWSAHTSKVTKLCDLGASSGASAEDSSGDSATGIEWTNRGSTLAIGTNKGEVQIWDAEKCKKIRTMTGHTGRVGCLAWNEHILSTGSRDRSILHRDVRVPEHYIRELKGHRQEVCGLRWNTATDQLASGGNDNKLFIWDKTNELPLYRFSEHTAAVKAIAWSPHHRGILASGGGTADKKIRFWNGLTGSMLSEWDTGSQVCNLMWSKNSNELVSTHGYSGGLVSNQICIWRYPTMQQVATLSGHTYRVLYLAMSPDGQTIVTGAGDETLRFWNAFQKKKNGETLGLGSDGLTGPGVLPSKREENGLNPFVRIR